MWVGQNILTRSKPFSTLQVAYCLENLPVFVATMVLSPFLFGAEESSKTSTSASSSADKRWIGDHQHKYIYQYLSTTTYRDASQTILNITRTYCLENMPGSTEWTTMVLSPVDPRVHSSLSPRLRARVMARSFFFPVLHFRRTWGMRCCNGDSITGEERVVLFLLLLLVLITCSGSRSLYIDTNPGSDALANSTSKSVIWIGSASKSFLHSLVRGKLLRSSSKSNVFKFWLREQVGMILLHISCSTATATATHSYLQWGN